MNKTEKLSFFRFLYYLCSMKTKELSLFDGSLELAESNPIAEKESRSNITRKEDNAHTGGIASDSSLQHLKKALEAIKQPKTVTHASYSLTAIQEDILTLISAGLQDNASTKVSQIISVQRDLFDQLCVVLDAKNFEGLMFNKNKLLAQVKELKKKEFQFCWKYDVQEKLQDFTDVKKTLQFETEGTIITTIHNVKNTSKIILNINPWCIPYLLYYGKNVGGTKYFKEIALGLSGKYSKRIYKMIMDWHTMGDFHEESIKDFRYCLQIPESYDNNKIKTEILDRAVTEIASSGSHITFSYELVTKQPSSSKTKKAADTIAFTFYGNHRKKDTQQENIRIMEMELKYIADRGIDKQLCADCAKKIVFDNKFDLILSKFSYYRQRLNDKRINESEFNNILLKIILEETGYDLRSAEHRMNSKRYKRKNGMI